MPLGELLIWRFEQKLRRGGRGRRPRPPAMMLLLALSAFVACAMAFHASPFLPPLLTFENGTTVETAEAWRERRAEVSRLAQVSECGCCAGAVTAHCCAVLCGAVVRAEGA